MGALCNFIPYFDYSALILLLSGLFQNSFIQILILQGLHHSKETMVIFHKNKNRIRWSWKIYRVKYSHLLLYCSILTMCFTLHNIPFGFKIFSIAESYQITYSFNIYIHNSYLTLLSSILLSKTRAELKLFSFTLIHSHWFIFSPSYPIKYLFNFQKITLHILLLLH